MLSLQVIKEMPEALQSALDNMFFAEPESQISRAIARSCPVMSAARQSLAEHNSAELVALCTGAAKAFRGAVHAPDAESALKSQLSTAQSAHTAQPKFKAAETLLTTMLSIQSAIAKPERGGNFKFKATRASEAARDFARFQEVSSKT